MISNNIEYILYIPVVARLWKQHELWDGTYTLSDLMDVLEALNIHNTNKSLAINYAIEKAKNESVLNNEMNRALGKIGRGY